MKKYICLKLRNFCGKQREGFVIFYKQKIPQIIMEDIVFQLFQPLYPNIICPQVYYFTHSQQILNYSQLENIHDEYVYVHFMERISQYKSAGNIKRSIKLCQFKLLARGIGVNGCKIFILSEKQYQIYKNKKYCKMIKQRIDEINISQQKIIDSLQQFINTVQPLVQLENDQRNYQNIKKQIAYLENKNLELQQIEDKLLKTEYIVLGALKQIGIQLKNINKL